MFNRNLNGGSLFGNANTSTPTSTPTPATNSFQLPPKTGGLFGSTNGGINASSPSPAGGLFNNSHNSNSNSTNITNQRHQGTNTTNGGLFGTTKNSSPSLFGNGNVNSTSQPSAVGGLFSKPNEKTQLSFNSNNSNNLTRPTNGGGLFSSANMQTKPSGLFSNGISATQSNGLFGNTQSNTSGSGGISSQSSVMNAASTSNSNPYGINIGADPISISSMPASITASLPSDKKRPKPASGSSDSSLSDSQRTYSVSSTNSNFTMADSAVPVTAQSSLIKKLSNRLKTGQHVSSTQGIFSPFQKSTWSIEDQGATSNNSSLNGLQGGVKGKNAVSVKDLSVFALHKGDLSEMRKLKIDPTRSSAKKLRLFSGEAIQTKLRETESIGNNDEDVPKRKIDVINGSSSSKDSIDSPKPDFKTYDENIVKEDENDGISDSSYWSSPPVEQLKMLSPSQLMSVSNFVIGRKGYGYITFNYDVDLTALSKNFEEELFGKTVKFHPTKTVEVYPVESEKAPIGTGLNVPATITLENIYPIDKKTKRIIKDGTRFDEIQVLIRKLKNMRNMEFISYNPFGGVWTFKVNHFSVWGLINEEDAEIDENEICENEKESRKGRSIVYPKPKRELAQSNKTQKDDVPGGFLVTPPIFMTGKNSQKDLFELKDQSYIDLNKDLTISNGEPPLEEKPYEPDVEECDFEGLEAEPSLDISNDWIEQLKLAGSNLRSIFVASKDMVSQDNNEIDMLFAEFNEGMALERKIKKERKLQNETFCHFANDMTILKKDINRETGVKKTPVPFADQRNFDLFRSTVIKHIHLSVVTERNSNYYPLVSRSSLQFKDISDSCKNDDIKFWKLCSILFDAARLPYEVENESIKVCLLKKEKHKALCSWIVEQVKEEVDSKIDTSSNVLDTIFLYLGKNDITTATKLAIQSQNGHLAILITLLGSNDGRVRALATQQLVKWKSSGRAIDPRIRRIYKLLTGDIYEDNIEMSALSTEFSWLVLLGFDLYYGRIDEYSLEQFICRYIRLCKPDTNDISCVIFKLFSVHTSSKDFFKEIKVAAKVLDKTFLWYFIQIMRFTKRGSFSSEVNDKLTFGLIAELRIAQLHTEAIFATCFLTDDTLAKDQLDSIIFQEISRFTNCDHDDILKQLKVPRDLIYKAQSLWDQYNGDFLGQTQNLLKAKCFKEAEKIIITNVAPTLILAANFSETGAEQKTLRKLLSSFPQEQMDNWNEGLGVFDNYLKLTLEGQENEKLFNSLLDGLSIIFEKNKKHRRIPVCCNLMSQTISSIIIEKYTDKINDLYKGKLLHLPLGHPERKYLQSFLLGV